MKGDWDRRAEENPRYYIATSQWETEEEFDRSGAREAGMFFGKEEEKLLTGETVLVNIGCGIGRIDKHLAPKVGRLIGVDISGKMIALAQERLAGLANVELIENDGWTKVTSKEQLSKVIDRSKRNIYRQFFKIYGPDEAFYGYLLGGERYVWIQTVDANTLKVNSTNWSPVRGSRYDPFMY